MPMQANPENLVPRFSFQIHEVLDSGQITGRNCGDDLPVGITFTTLVRRDFTGLEPDGSYTSPKPHFVSDISLRLHAAELYRRNVDVVASGYTALLGISGEGISGIRDLVASASARTSYSLCAFDA